MIYISNYWEIFIFTVVMFIVCVQMCQTFFVCMVRPLKKKADNYDLNVFYEAMKHKKFYSEFGCLFPASRVQ